MTKPTTIQVGDIYETRFPAFKVRHEAVEVLETASRPGNHWVKGSDYRFRLSLEIEKHWAPKKMRKEE